MKKVTFVPRAVAQVWKPDADSVLISISATGQLPLQAQDGWQDILRLQFHDADVAKEGIELFNPEQARAVLAFVEAHRDRAQLVVHCELGQSRSAAVALFIAEQLDVPCFAENAPASLATWPHFNRHVLRTLYNAVYGEGSAFGEIER